MPERLLQGFPGRDIFSGPVSRWGFPVSWHGS